MLSFKIERAQKEIYTTKSNRNQTREKYFTKRMHIPWWSIKILLWSSAEQRCARAKAIRLWKPFSETRMRYNKCFSTYKKKINRLQVWIQKYIELTDNQYTSNTSIISHADYNKTRKIIRIWHHTRQRIFSSNLFNVLATQSLVACNRNHNHVGQ